MSFSTLKYLFTLLGYERGQFSMPFEITPTLDWCSNQMVNLLAIGKKLPDRLDPDRNITSRYYKRHLRTIATGNDSSNIKLSDQEMG